MYSKEDFFEGTTKPVVKNSFTPLFYADMIFFFFSLLQYTDILQSNSILFKAYFG